MILGEGAAAPLEEANHVGPNFKISLASALAIFSQGVQQSIERFLL